MLIVSENKIRLDLFLLNNSELSSRSLIQKLIKSGNVKIDHKMVTKPSCMLSIGQIVDFSIPESDPVDYLASEDIPLDFVYEDDDIVVINKNRNMLVHPGCGNYQGTLINGLIYHYGDQITSVGGKDRPGIVHRLDKDTSGLLVVAKNDFSFQHLVKQFSNRTISRKYVALVWGKTPPEGRWERNIARSKSDYKKMTTTYRGGKYALTEFNTIKNFGNLISLISCKLYTGRTHQIRVHANHYGFPIDGDPIYCKSNQKLCQKMPDNLRELLKQIDFQCLHAKKLKFVHPKTNQLIVFSVDIPSDINLIVECLNNSSL